MPGKIEKSETKSIDLRESLKKELKRGSRSKTLFLPKDGVVLKFVEEDDYFKALGDGVYSFKGFIDFLDGSKIVRVNNGILKETGKGYVLEGDFSWDYVFEVVEDATREDIEREVVNDKEVLETKKVGDKEKPTVVRYGLKTGRQVLYDLEREIIATGVDVGKEEGAYKVGASKDFSGVIRVLGGPGSEGKELAKTTTPRERLLLDIDKKIVATGFDVEKRKGVYTVWASENDRIPAKLVIDGKLVLEESFGEYWLSNIDDGVWRIERADIFDFHAVVDLDNNINVSGYRVQVWDKHVYKVLSALGTLVNVKTLDGKTILENAKGTYKIFKKGDSWQVEKLRDEDG